MKIEKFEKVTDLVLDQILPATELKHIPWQDLYSAIATLKKEMPDGLFRTVPLRYVDLARGSAGFLFVDSRTETVYYVFR